jgi:hypothetical protein
LNDDPESPPAPPLNLEILTALEIEQNTAPQRFRFLTDHNVPDSVGNALTDLGHDVVRLREVMAANATDPVVAQAAIQDSRILVSWDRDFNQQRFMSPRFVGLSRLSMSGPEMDGAARVHTVFDIISFALSRAAGLPITIRIGVGKVQIHV